MDSKAERSSGRVQMGCLGVTTSDECKYLRRRVIVFMAGWYGMYVCMTSFRGREAGQGQPKGGVKTKGHELFLV